MTPDEIGLLVLKMQDDDVRASEMRTFIKALMTDEEIRRNARLVASLSGLPREVREQHCRANAMMLLSIGELGPTTEAVQWHPTTKLFRESFYICIGGPWKAHIRGTNDSPQEWQMRIRKLGTRRSSGMPELSVSEELLGHLRAVEDFWGVRGYLVP